MGTDEKENSRIVELEFLISVLTDLSMNYHDHNSRLLEELISNLEYRRNNEELTKTAKSKSEEYLQRKRNGSLYKNHHAM